MSAASAPSLSQWLLARIEPLAGRRVLIVRDPLELIRPGDYMLDGWASEHGYTALLARRNLALRDVWERQIRPDPEARFLLVDRTGPSQKRPLFYPDIAAQAGPEACLSLSLRDYLVEATGDPAWPPATDEPALARLLVSSLEEVLQAHRQLRAVDKTRFADDDLQRIALGAALGINPFLKSQSAPDLRRLCVERHGRMKQLSSTLNETALGLLRKYIAAAPAPFDRLLTDEPETIMRAFTLAALMQQHALEYQLLLGKLDPELHAYSEIDPKLLAEAVSHVDRDSLSEDVRRAEQYLLGDPNRMRFLLAERLQLGEPDAALSALQRERLSLVIRCLALASLLAHYLSNIDESLYKEVQAALEAERGAKLLSDHQPAPEWAQCWQALTTAFERAGLTFALARRVDAAAKHLKVTAPADLNFETFDDLWRKHGVHRLEYSLGDLDRKLRAGPIDVLIKQYAWPDLRTAFASASATFSQLAEEIRSRFTIIDARFQDFYRAQYPALVRDSNAPMIFTHQFLPRMLKGHWDPKSGRKAVILVFDGMRTDAWAELLRPVLLERFNIVNERAGSAILPSETQLSRKAIAAGTLPEVHATGHELKLLQAWLEKHMGIKPVFTTRANDESAKSRISVHYESKQLDYIVFNFTDDLHEAHSLAPFYDTVVRDMITQEVRSLIYSLSQDALIFVTSDHGFGRVPGKDLPIPAQSVHDGGDVTYRNARLKSPLPPEISAQTVSFTPQELGIKPVSNAVKDAPVTSIVFPRPACSLRRPHAAHKPPEYAHGGLSMAECMIPVVVLEKPSMQRLAELRDVKQIIVPEEGSPAELWIEVGTATLLPELALTMHFSRPELAERHEELSSKATTYKVRWTPDLSAVTPDERRNGEIMLPLVVTLIAQSGDRVDRSSRSVQVRFRLKTTLRSVDGKLDLLMGKPPKGALS